MTRKTLGIKHDAEATKANRQWGVTGVRLERLKERARTERADPTEAQRLLWAQLGNSQLGGVKFRQQMIVGSVIVDFACPSRWLVVEVTAPDDNAEVLALQDGKLSDGGIRVLRFDEAQVLDDIDAVTDAIRDAIDAPFDRRRPDTAAAFVEHAE